MYCGEGAVNSWTEIFRSPCHSLKLLCKTELQQRRRAHYLTEVAKIVLLSFGFLHEYTVSSSLWFSFSHHLQIEVQAYTQTKLSQEIKQSEFMLKPVT